MNGDAADGAIERLLGSTLLVPTPDGPGAPGSWEMVEREVLSMLMAEDDLGLLAPAFTSVDALAVWRPEGGTYVERDAEWFFGVAAADESGRVVIDLGSPSAVFLGPAEVAALAAGVAPATGAPTDSVLVLVSTPLDPLPPEVTAAMHDVVAAERSVLSARLLQLDVGAERQQVVFVDLAKDLGESEVGDVMTRIIDGIVARTAEAAGLRFMVVTPEWRQPYESGGIEVLGAR